MILSLDFPNTILPAYGCIHNHFSISYEYADQVQGHTLFIKPDSFDKLLTNTVYLFKLQVRDFSVYRFIKNVAIKFFVAI